MAPRSSIITNAAGGLNPAYRPGDLMALKDHINLPGLAGMNPLVGADEPELGVRFLDMTDQYDEPSLRARALELGAELGVPIHEGVYVVVAGPSFETRAELRFLRQIGADAVGMSTVPEVIVARHERMRVLGISVITNTADPDAVVADVSHEGVLNVAERAASGLAAIVRGVLRTLDGGAAGRRGVTLSRNFLRQAARTGIIRAVRTATLGLILLAILALPFPASAVAAPDRPAAAAARTSASTTSLPPRGRGGRRCASRAPRGELSDDSSTTLDRLLATPRPQRDPVALASRLTGSRSPGRPPSRSSGRCRSAGRTRSTSSISGQPVQAPPATLRHVSQHAYWYVQTDRSVRDDDLAAAAAQFDQVVVPTVRELSAPSGRPASTATRG